MRSINVSLESLEIAQKSSAKSSFGESHIFVFKVLKEYQDNLQIKAVCKSAVKFRKNMHMRFIAVSLESLEIAQISSAKSSFGESHKLVFNFRNGYPKNPQIKKVFKSAKPNQDYYESKKS